MCLDANQNWILTGTLSFGMDCSTVKKGQTKPDVYTKIGYYSDWIQQVLEQYQ
jgi:secreted trypsin-like serine protease